MKDYNTSTNNFRGNLLSNYLGSFFSALAPILAVPFYISSLGINGYGLISFVILLQTILGIIESGISQGLTKELIDCNIKRDEFRSASIFHGFEAIYFITSISIFFLVYFSSNFIATEWLDLNESSSLGASEIIEISALLLATTLPGSLYRSALLSINSHVIINTITAASISSRHIIGVIVAVSFQTPQYLVLWFAISAAIETLTKRLYAKRNYSNTKPLLRTIIPTIRPIIKQFANLVFGTLIGATAVQFDKLISSKMLSIEEFGYFTLASTISMGFLQLIYPINTSSLPLIIAAQNNRQNLLACNLKILKAVSCLFIIAWIMILLFGNSLLVFWLNDSKIAKIVYPIFCLLFLGTTLNAVYGIGLNNLLASGKFRTIKKINILSFASTAFTLPIFITNFGLVGAPSGWIAFNLCALLVTIIWYRRSHFLSLNSNHD